jgi:hypothetical protein
MLVIISSGCCVSVALGSSGAERRLYLQSSSWVQIPEPISQDQTDHLQSCRRGCERKLQTGDNSQEQVVSRLIDDNPAFRMRQCDGVRCTTSITKCAMMQDSPYAVRERVHLRLVRLLILQSRRRKITMMQPRSEKQRWVDSSKYIRSEWNKNIFIGILAYTIIVCTYGYVNSAFLAVMSMGSLLLMVFTIALLDESPERTARRADRRKREYL